MQLHRTVDTEDKAFIAGIAEKFDAIYGDKFVKPRSYFRFRTCVIYDDYSVRRVVSRRQDAFDAAARFEKAPVDRNDDVNEGHAR